MPGRKQWAVALKATALPAGLVVIPVRSEGAERGGYVAVRTCEKSAGDHFKLLRRQVARELTAEYSIVLLFRHEFSFSLLLVFVL